MKEAGLNEVTSQTDLRAKILRRFTGSEPRHDLTDWRVLGVDAEAGRGWVDHHEGGAGWRVATDAVADRAGVEIALERG